MFGKLKLFWSLFQNGKELKDQRWWARGEAYCIPALVSFLVGCLELAKAFNINLALDYDTVYSIAGVVYFLVCTCLAFIRSKHVGLPARTSGEAQQAVPSDEDAGTASADAEVQSEPLSGPSSRFDDETLARAKEWLERQRLDDKPGGVFYSP